MDDYAVAGDDYKYVLSKLDEIRAMVSHRQRERLDIIVNILKQAHKFSWGDLLPQENE